MAHVAACVEVADRYLLQHHDTEAARLRAQHLALDALTEAVQHVEAARASLWGRLRTEEMARAECLDEIVAQPATLGGRWTVRPAGSYLFGGPETPGGGLHRRHVGDTAVMPQVDIDGEATALMPRMVHPAPEHDPALGGGA